MGSCQSKKDGKNPQQLQKVDQKRRRNSQDQSISNTDNDLTPKSRRNKAIQEQNQRVNNQSNQRLQSENNSQHQLTNDDKDLSQDYSKAHQTSKGINLKAKVQAKREGNQDKNKGQSSQVQKNGQPGVKKIQNASQNMSTSRTKKSLILSPHTRDSQTALQDILEASYKGNLVDVGAIIDKFKVEDISNIVGKELVARIGRGRNTKQFKNTQLWNPLIYAIAGRQEEIVKYLFQKLPLFHKVNCLAKPYSKESQKEIAFDYSKKIRRESFSLKVSIRNEDDKVFKYLWNENRLLWNLGHFFQCLNKIMKIGWETGLKILMNSTTSKVIFMSISNVPDFIDCIDLIRQELIIAETANPKMVKKLKDHLFNRPYFIYSIFLEIADFTDKPNRDLLQACLQKISQDDVQFLHSQLRELFEVLDDTNCLEQFRDRMLIKFEDRDSEIERYQKGLARIFEKDSSVDDPEHLSILEELDLYAFNTIVVNDENTNAMIAAMRRGFQNIIDYCFDSKESFLNLRSIIRKNNKFEVQNDVAKFHTEYFLDHSKDSGQLKYFYTNLVDLLQLNNFIEIFNDLAKAKSTGEFLIFVLEDIQFLSLFQASLELQKILFVQECVKIFNKYKLTNELQILQLEPYNEYYQKVNSENQDEDYTSKTFAHLDYLDKKKMDTKTRKATFQSKASRGSGLIEFTVFKYGSPQRQRKSQHVDSIDVSQININMDYNKQNLMQLPSQRIEGEESILDSRRAVKEESQIDRQNNTKGIQNRGLSVVKERQSENRETEKENSPLKQSENSNRNKIFIKEEKPKQSSKVIDSNKQSQQQLLSPTASLMPKLQIPSPKNQTKQSLRGSLRQGYQPTNDEEPMKVLNGDQLLSPTKEQDIKPMPDQQSEKSIIDLKRNGLKSGEQPPLKNQIQGPEKTVDDMEEEDDQADASDDEDNDKSRQLSQRLPNVLEKRQSAKNPLFDILSLKESEQKIFERLPVEIIDSIRTNNIQKLKYLIAKFSLKNITWIKNVDGENELPVIGYHFPELKETVNNAPKSPDRSKSSRKSSPQKRERVQDGQGNEKPSFDTKLWNPVLYAIYYQRVEMVKLLLLKYVTNFALAIRLPPVNEFTEYIIPGQRPMFEQWGKGGRMNFQNETDNSFSRSPGNNTSVVQDKSMFSIPYNPSDARVECFGIELAIRNQDFQTFNFLWNEQAGMWEERHFSFVLDKILSEHWDVGIGCLFRSRTSHMIFKALNPEDKDNFLFSKIVDKVTDTEYWEREMHLENFNQQEWINFQKPTIINERQTQLVLEEISLEPYGRYACLKYPALLDKQSSGTNKKGSLLEDILPKVRDEDVYDYLVARKENARHLCDFIDQYSLKPVKCTNILERLRQIQTLAQNYDESKRKAPIEPKDIVQLIKLGDVNKLKEYFELTENKQQLEQLNLMQGHIDIDYQKLYQSNVKYIPSDETIQILLADNSTYEWNSIIFAIFYQKKEIVQYFCEQKQVYVRNCLTTPFIIEVDEDAEDLNEEKFIKEKTELFCLVMCIMLQNKDIFRYLWRQCAYLWNDIHFVTLAYFIFESQWIDGIKVLFASSHSHQLFNAMNMYEKEKFLRFCDRSIAKINISALKDFRYSMSFDPYNIYYLPLVISREDIEIWDDDASKEMFIKNCQLNFDDRSFVMLNRMNSHYVSEFISTGENCQSQVIVNFAKKLQRYAAQY